MSKNDFPFRAKQELKCIHVPLSASQDLLTYLQVGLSSRGSGFELDGEDWKDEDVENDSHGVPKWTGNTVLKIYEGEMKLTILNFSFQHFKVT